MAGFRKAKAEQAALKMGIFGPPGSGKTFTTLLLMEGIAQLEGKRIAYWDTERGTDFYALAVPNRRVHPAAFDFDALYTRSVTEGFRALQGLDPKLYSCVAIDSMTHIWEATINAYTGPRVKGKIPFHAWGNIKKPYKDLMNWMLNTPLHVFILGRQANEWNVDDDTGETVAGGVKMKAEGETQYEPHVVVRMEGVKPLRADGKTVKKNAEAIPTMFVMKDRTGVLQGMVIENPTFEAVAAPLLPLLGKTQAKMETDEEVQSKDSEALREAERAKARRSADLKREFLAKFELAKTVAEIDAVAAGITPAVKKEMLAADLDEVRSAYKNRLAGLPAGGTAPEQQSPPTGEE